MLRTVEHAGRYVPHAHSLRFVYMAVLVHVFWTLIDTRMARL